MAGVGVGERVGLPRRTWRNKSGVFLGAVLAYSWRFRRDTSNAVEGAWPLPLPALAVLICVRMVD
jgi:hypothetical protein